MERKNTFDAMLEALPENPNTAQWLRILQSNAVVVEMMPYRSIAYLRLISRRVYAINFTKNSRARYWCWLVITLALIIALRHFLLLTVQLDPIDRICLFDGIFIYGQSKMYNFFLGINFLMIATMTHGYYITNHPATVLLMIRTYVLLDSSYFLQPTLKLSNGTKIGVCEQLLEQLQLITQSLMVFTLSLDGFIIYSHYQMYELVTENWDLLTQSNMTWLIVKLLWMELNNLLVCFSFFLHAHALVVLAMTFIGFTMIVYTQIGQVKRRLAKRVNWVSGPLLRKLTTAHWKAVWYILEANRIYSYLLVVYLVAAIPYNIYLVPIFFNGSLNNVNLINGIFFLIFAAQQWLGIFAIHLLCAFYTRLIHRYVPKRLIHYDTRLKLRPLNTHLKVSYYVEKFHTRNRYGVTYGRYGLVTIEGFAKYLMMYCKFLMMAFKLQRPN